MRDGNEALAIQYFADALKLKPENSELRQHLIQLYTANGMMEKAAALK
jgi:protein involved in temperature-dependent protein secretion